MNLTFKGFLRTYCHELTGLDTDNLKKLCSAVTSTAPAAAEAVMVFAAVQGKEQYLAKISCGTPVCAQYRAMAIKLHKCKDIKQYLAGKNAPIRYQKVLDAYHGQKFSIDADRRIIALMRDKTLSALSASKTTVYAVCKALDLNKGNIYAYLHKGDTSKVSKKTACRIMTYVQQCAAPKSIN